VSWIEHPVDTGLRKAQSISSCLGLAIGCAFGQKICRRDGELRLGKESREMVHPDGGEGLELDSRGMDQRKDLVVLENCSDE
jgi:hypothetical protein